MTLHILLVEDNALNRELAQDLLEAGGHQVRVAVDGAALACQLRKESQVRPDIILMDILLPDASSRIPALQRNAGGRLFKTGAELNSFLQKLNASGGVNGQPLPLVSNDARFNDNFSSLDLRLSKVFRLAGTRIKASLDMYNALNANPALTYNQTFNPAVTTGAGAWLTPTGVLAARVMKIGASIDF